MALKYKIGDRVKIKSLDWYNENKDGNGNVRRGCQEIFNHCTARHCGQILTIKCITSFGEYEVEEEAVFVNDGMIERLVERNGKTYPYKIGDRVVLKGSNKCATITDLRYNSCGNLSYYIKIDNDKDINISYPTDLLLPCDNIVKEKTKPKFKVGDEVIAYAEGILAKFSIKDVRWNGELNKFEYRICASWYDESVMQLYKESDNGLPFNEWLSHKGAFHVPDGYEIKDENGDVINTTKITLEKRKMNIQRLMKNVV